jgi:tetratricopeptide (TPR) repeat protein
VAAIAAGAYPDAVPPLAEATKLALTAGDLALAVEAFAQHVFAAVAVAQDTAPASIELIEAIAAGLPPSEHSVRAQLDSSLASVALAAGNRDQARAAYERALGNAREVTGSARLPLLTIWTNLASTIDDPDRRIALARERVAIVESELDADHPRVLTARISVANLESSREREREGLEAPCMRLVDLQPDRRPEIVDCQFRLGWLAFERGDTDAARVAFGHAVATESPGLMLTLARAYLDLLAGRPSEATREIDAAAARLGPLEQAPWYVLYEASELMLARGAVARAAGRTADARSAFDAARQMLETVVKVKSVPRYTRPLAFAWTSLVRAWSDGPLPPAIRGHAEAAIAWYRAAGGYADVIAELERALARGA